MNDIDTPTVLTTLLDRAQAFAPEYRGDLSNHLPMALVALDSLGADAARMASFFTVASAKLDPVPRPAHACKDWSTKRGDLTAFASLRAHFSEAITANGRDATLRQTLPLLVDGVGAAAFHGLLRTASAMVAQHDDELASGLAHWACWHMPLEAFVAAPTESDPDVSMWLAGIAKRANGWRSEAGLIALRMMAFAQTPAFRDGVDRLAVHDGTLRELATQALAIYLRTKNFTVLHLITSAHALRLLMPWIDAPLIAVRHYARTYAAGVAASGVKVDAPMIAVNVLPWPDVLRAGAASDDEHVIKLVYACHEEWKVTGDVEYQRAASLVVSA
jgi:Questin oxidase-like